MTIAAISVTPSPRPSLWSRLAQARRLWTSTRRRAETAVPDAAADRNSEAGGVVGAKKCAVFVDRRGRLRVIELYLPTDVLADMRQPIEVRFLEGEEDIRADQIKHGISSNFHGFK